MPILPFAGVVPQHNPICSSFAALQTLATQATCTVVIVINRSLRVLLYTEATRVTPESSSASSWPQALSAAGLSREQDPRRQLPSGEPRELLLGHLQCPQQSDAVHPGGMAHWPWRHCGRHQHAWQPWPRSSPSSSPVACRIPSTAMRGDGYRMSLSSKTNKCRSRTSPCPHGNWH